MKPEIRKTIRVEVLRFTLKENEEVECDFCEDFMLEGDHVWVMGFSRSQRRQPVELCLKCLQWLEGRGNR